MYSSHFVVLLPKRPAEDEYGYAFEGFGGDQPLPNLAYPCLSHFKPEDILISSTACLVDQVLQSVEKEVNLILFSPLHP
ncbi:hypothetical protein NQ317_014975 [Molorchus minor]|uniref:Uncharacterized protein n=1 Tax=Molorchus minor TaxID=1323400 RepID=A0ABQ9IQK0_9CUCU|nr:hypothetical protein NQ317_014975 [Molorchus minor]